MIVNEHIRIGSNSHEKDLDSASNPTLSLFPSFSLPDVLCDPTDLIWRKGIPFETMTGRTSPSSDGLLAEVYRGFSSAVRQMLEN